MECPFCEGELMKTDSFGYFCAHQSGKRLGDIYECPVARGHGEDDTICESDDFHGLFHTLDSTGELYNGYPC